MFEDGAEVVEWRVSNTVISRTEGAVSGRGIERPKAYFQGTKALLILLDGHNVLPGYA